MNATRQLPPWEARIEAMKRDFYADVPTLTEIDEYQYDSMLNAVPPARFTRLGYACGECYTFSAEGEVFYCGFEIDGRYAMGLMTLAEFDKITASDVRRRFLLSGLNLPGAGCMRWI